MKNIIDTWTEALFNAKSDEIFLALMFVFITIIAALDMTGILPLMDIIAGFASWI